MTVNPPGDIMGPAGMNTKFATTNIALLQAAEGIEPTVPSDATYTANLLQAMKVYQKNWTLPTSLTGLPTSPDEPIAAPEPILDVQGPNGDDLGNGVAFAAGTVLADGAGGQKATISLLLSDTGSAPLSLQSISLGAGDDGFSISGTNPEGTTLDVGQSVALTIVFDPTKAGPATDTLSINSSSIGLPFGLPLAGSGLTRFGQVSTTVADDALTLAPNDNFGGAIVGGPPVIKRKW